MNNRCLNLQTRTDKSNCQIRQNNFANYYFFSLEQGMKQIRQRNEKRNGFTLMMNQSQ